ncbi:PREDICTED: probable protein phosphatase 2C 25 [Ipomoea nil]|uniref:probable protein phosphatase 2C 25 n=1 Tax=Ipomoea nil TaxID=35883 RepID=UPI000901C42E|nr:PREDICTED: probable protein phosphatase 2C 25 [Ipomoea nil]
MSCTVAISSPVFSSSPSRLSVSSSLLCKAAAAEALTRTLSPSSAAASSFSSSSSPLSPLRVHRLSKPPPSGLIQTSSDSSPSSSTSPTDLKRKRPARLNIPIVPMSFGNIIPATPSSVMEDLVEFEGDSYSVCCKRGRRGGAMEDRYSAMLNLHGDSKQAIFGVFDGHGGAKAAEYAAQNLSKKILDEIEKSENDEEIKEAVKHGYLKTDSEFLEQDVRGGSCCVTALIRNGNLVVSNAGDCRAVLSRGGVAEALTSDHRPSRPDEKDRIEALGGFVDCGRGGVWRIQGSLAVSRGIGDRSLKQWISAEPETRILTLDSQLDFLILASDGLWDKVSTQEAVDVARAFCNNGVDKPQLLSGCKKLIDLSVSRGSIDDVSVMLIPLGKFC